MKRLTLICVFCCLQMFLSVCYARDIYTIECVPPVDSYKFDNHATIDQPFEITWDMVKAYTTNVGDKKYDTGIVQDIIKNDFESLEGPKKLVDCGRVTNSQMYFDIYPSEIHFEIKLDSSGPSNDKTFIKINLIAVGGGWRGRNAGNFYPLTGSHAECISVDKCISTGEYEGSLLRTIQSQIFIKKEKAMRAEKEYREKIEKEQKEKEQKEQEGKRQRQKQEQKQKMEEEKKARELATELEWKKAGFNSDEMKRWENGGFVFPVVAKLAKSKCPKGPGSLENYLGNPYEVEGKCYILVGRSLQLLSRTRALYETSVPGIVFGKIALIDFAPDFAPEEFFAQSVQYFFKGIGVFKYTAVRGNLQIVPHFQAIRLPNKETKDKKQ